MRLPRSLVISPMLKTLAIKRSLAEHIYPDTDIVGEWVTVEVGELSQEKVEEALNHGLSKAESICRKGLIKGALVAVQGKVVWTRSMEPGLTKIVKEGLGIRV